MSRFSFEQLEDRTLMAVNVRQAGATLFITGDNAGDDVRLEGTGVLGQINLSINGGGAQFFSGIRNIHARFGTGDNELSLDGVQIGGNLVAQMGPGDDEVDIDNYSSIADDDFSVFIGGHALLYMGGQTNDFVEFDTDGGDDDDITIGKNLLVSGAADVELDGDGGSSALETDDVNILGRVVIQSQVANDVNGDGFTVQLDDVNVGAVTQILLGNGVDFVDIGDSSLAGRLTVKLGFGDDTLDLDSGADSNLFGGAVFVDGGLGFDTFDDDLGNVFDSTKTIRNFDDFP